MPVWPAQQHTLLTDLILFLFCLSGSWYLFFLFSFSFSFFTTGRVLVKSAYRTNTNVTTAMSPMVLTSHIPANTERSAAWKSIRVSKGMSMGTGMGVDGVIIEGDLWVRHMIFTFVLPNSSFSMFRCFGPLRRYFGFRAREL